MFAYELWAEGRARHDMFSQLKQSPFLQNNRFIGHDSSFKILVESFNKKITREQKVEKIEQMNFLPLEGPINLKNPDNTFALIEFYGMTQTEAGPDPDHIYFGRLISDSGRSMIHKFNLKERKFISNTSMDPTLSFIMSNIARVGKGDFVLDPFVGSGSLLVAAAKFGSLVIGGDIDYKLLYGLSRPTRPNVKKRSSDETIYNNLFQYGLQSQYLDILLADASLPVFRDSFCFDAIISDPPYGIRESSQRVGTEKKGFKIPEELVPLHFPSKVQYNLHDIIEDLLEFSAKYLKIQGRVVFWMPVLKNESGSLIDFIEPQHNCLSIVSKSEQVLSQYTSRILYCLEKEREPSTPFVRRSFKDASSNSNFRDNFFKSVESRIQAKKQNDD
jgi:tRNA (guanine10-N2)-methyltransferase